MGIIFNNFGQKVLALFAALVFWVFLLGINNTVYEIPNAVEIKAFNLAPEYAVKDSLGSVNIKVSTEKGKPKAIEEGDFEAFVDLQGMKDGKHKAMVSVTSQLTDLTIVKIEPKEIELDIELIKEKALPLEVKVIGSPAEGFEVQDATSSIEKLILKGASTSLLNAVSLKAVIELKGDEDKSFVSTITPIAFNESNEPIDGILFSEEEVNVNVNIDEIETTKTVGVEVVSEGEIKNAYIEKMQVVPQTIVIQGKEDALKNIDSLKTEALNIELFSNGGTVSKKLILPKGVKLKKNEPSSVIVNLFVKKYDN